MKKFSLLILIVLLIGLIPMVGAQEPEVGSAEDNACNEGGSMAGKCDTDWEWDCGYYLTRWEKAGGWFGNYLLPTACASLLPPMPVSPSGVPIATNIVQICKTFPTFTLCLSSDQTGTDDRTGTAHVDYLHMFGNFPTVASCPAAPAGYPQQGYNPSTNAWLGFYTANELYTVLSLGPNNCYNYR